MRYAITGDTGSPAFRRFVDALGEELAGRGYVRAGADPAADLVVNMIDADDPQAVPPSLTWHVRRGRPRARAHPRRHPQDQLPAARAGTGQHRAPLRPGHGVWFTTMERGHYGVEAEDPGPLARGVAERLVPLATSKLVIDNEFLPRPGAGAVGR